ncbi:hypothetical protein H8D57_00855 [bacterium]|nr:hypothetical protein [bacterium]
MSDENRNLMRAGPDSSPREIVELIHPDVPFQQSPPGKVPFSKLLPL